MCDMYDGLYDGFWFLVGWMVGDGLNVVLVELFVVCFIRCLLLLN